MSRPSRPLEKKHHASLRILLVSCLFSVVYIAPNRIYSQTGNKDLARPFIWVKQHERDLILKKIKEQPWAASFYNHFLARLDPDYQAYRKNWKGFLMKIPFVAGSKARSFPPLKTVDNSEPGASSLRTSYQRYLQIGIDCGVVYYLNGDGGYAQCALDILNVFINGLVQIKPSASPGNGGWLYPDDHLREARESGPCG